MRIKLTDMNWARILSLWKVSTSQLMIVYHQFMAPTVLESESVDTSFMIIILIGI